MARRKLVTCRQGAFEEGNAGEVLIVLHNRFSNPYSPGRFGLTSPMAARDKAVPIPDKVLRHCKYANGRALDLEPIEKNFANESMQFSFEEESDDMVCEISESVVRDVEKAAIELLAAR